MIHGFNRVLFLGCLALPSCQQGTPDDELSRVDSAGIEIITVADISFDENAFGTAPEPDWKVGAVSGGDEYLLSRVGGAIPLSDGRIVVSDGGTKQLRYFNQAGRFLSSVGGDGDGPGEFRDVSQISPLPGDSLLVFDRNLQRISLIDPDGDFVTSWRVSAGGPAFLMGVGATQRGEMAAYVALSQEPELEGPYLLDALVGLVSRETGHFTALDTLAFSEEGRVDRNGRLLRAFVPLGRKSDIAVSRDAVHVLDARSSSEIRSFAVDGSWQSILRLELGRRAVSNGMVRDWTDSFVERYSEGSADLASFWRAGFARMPAPDSVPLIRSVEIDTEGNVCAERYGSTEMDERTYLCFAPDGEYLRSITIPPDFARDAHPHLEPQLFLAPDYVLGVWVDDLGVESVRRYRLTPRNVPSTVTAAAEVG